MKSAYCRFLVTSRAIRLPALVLVALLVAGCSGTVSRNDSGRTPAPLAASVAPSPPSAVPTVPATTTATPSPRASDVVETPPPFLVSDISVPDENGDSRLGLSVTVARLGSLSALTAADASCIAGGNLPSGARIISSGLVPKHANATGAVSWNFSASTTERGRASYTLTCSLGSSMRTLMVFFTIQ